MTKEEALDYKEGYEFQVQFSSNAAFWKQKS